MDLLRAWHTRGLQVMFTRMVPTTVSTSQRKLFIVKFLNLSPSLYESRTRNTQNFGDEYIRYAYNE